MSLAGIVPFLINPFNAICISDVVIVGEVKCGKIHSQISFVGRDFQQLDAHNRFGLRFTLILHRTKNDLRTIVALFYVVGIENDESPIHSNSQAKSLFIESGFGFREGNIFREVVVSEYFQIVVSYVIFVYRAFPDKPDMSFPIVNKRLNRAFI